MADEEQSVEIAPFPYPFVEDDEQKLRCFIAKYFANAEIDAAIMVENLQHIYDWIKDGTLVSRKKQRPTLVKP